MAASSVHRSGFLSEEAEDEDSDDAAPLNLSRKDWNRSAHTANPTSDEEINSESDSNDEYAPLDLCLRAQDSNQVQEGSPASSEDVCERVGVGQVLTAQSEQEQRERRHSAAFALCQLASSSSINTTELPLEPHKDSQSPSFQQQSSPDQAPHEDTSSEQNTAAQGPKRAEDQSTKSTTKRARVNELVRDKRRRTQNC